MISQYQANRICVTHQDLCNTELLEFLFFVGFVLFKEQIVGYDAVSLSICLAEMLL
jgi:hypothetical protein